LQQICRTAVRGHRSTRRRSLYDCETEEIPQEFHSDAAEGKIADKETHEEELATEDATDLGDFAADIAEQPLEDIETSEEETEEVPVPEFKSSFELTGKPKLKLKKITNHPNLF
jgi:hypothetical protein